MGGEATHVQVTGWIYEPVYIFYLKLSRPKQNKIVNMPYVFHKNCKAHTPHVNNIAAEDMFFFI
jgi:hypothetical protein